MKAYSTLFLLVFSFPLFAGINDTDAELNENEVGNKIQMIKEIPSTPVRDQYKTSTCWSFSGISLLETELIRMGKGVYDLSEMYIVRQNYEKKASRYVRMHGKTNFAPGGEANDVTDIYDEYGIVPEEVYTGLKVNESMHKHGEMDRILEKYVSAVVSDNKEISPVWKEGFTKVLDAYLGEIPETFEFQGEEFTPQTFASYLGIVPDNYVMVTSFMHHPYYEPIVLEIPDNWSWEESFNVPLDIMEEIVDSAILKGYSVEWAADISEEAFSFSEGMALAPRSCYAEITGHNDNKWNKKPAAEKTKEIFSLSNPVEELNITPEIRQAAFDNYSTTDDHGMQILGLGQDKNGRTFYYVKNSWGTDNPYDGYIYVSKPYFQFKTISIMVNKNAIPSYILDKLSF
jgi:bleomycin hydrolase